MTINTPGGSFEVPFGLGAILLALILLPILLIIIFTAFSMSKDDYVCDKCGERFKGKWYEFLFDQHFDSSDQVLRCPKCHKRRLCSRSYKQKRA